MGQPRRTLQGWTVFPLPFEDLSGIDWQPPSPEWKDARAAMAASDGTKLAAVARQQIVRASAEERTLSSAEEPKGFAPTLYRGRFNVSADLFGPVAGEVPHLPDTFLRMPGFTKGVAFVNGFNLGWYWPAVGPQLTLYVPGPVLRAGTNDLVLLEMEGVPDELSVELVDEPDFHFKAAHRSREGVMQQPVMPMSREMAYAERYQHMRF